MKLCVLLVFHFIQFTFPFIQNPISRKSVYSLRDSSIETNQQNVENEGKVLRRTALLISLWNHVAFPPPDDYVDFKLIDYGLDRNDVKGVLTHFQNCKDCAADNAFLIATQDDQDQDLLRLTSAHFPLLSEEDDEEWGDYDGLYAEADDELQTVESVFFVEPNDELVLQSTKNWVRKADFGICPFTVNANKAGIPLGGVRYTVSRAIGVDEAFLRFWEEVAALLVTPEKEMSTVLLVFPQLELFGNYELFEAYCDSLNDALCASCLGMETQLQLVFFHPKYQFRDGKARISDDPNAAAANFARRSPWPMINILRTPQVRAAQKGVPTGQVYIQNEQKLTAVGADKLQEMLRKRDWETLPSYSTPGKLLESLKSIPSSSVSSKNDSS